MQEQKTLAEYFKDCLTDEGQLNTASLLRVQNVEIRMEERKMVVKTVTDQILDPAFRQGLEETIAESFRGRLTVDLEVELENPSQSDDAALQERMEDAWNYVLEEEQRLRPMCYHILKNTEPEFLSGGRIRLPLPQETIHLLQFNGCLHSLEILMEKLVGQPVRVLAEAVIRDPRIDEMREARIQSKQEEFIRTGTAQTADTAQPAGMSEDADTPAAGSSQRAEDEIPAGKLIPVEPLPWEEEAAVPAEKAAEPAVAHEEPENEPAVPADRSMPAAANDPAEPETEDDEEDEDEAPRDEVLFGRAIRGKIGEYTAMEDGKRLILYGVVTSVSSREIKGGKTLVQLSLTDYQHEALVKSFIPTDQFGQISTRLENGITLMARGTVRADDFIHELTLVANSLMLCALPFEADPEVLESYNSMVVGMPYTPGELRPLRNIENVHGDVTIEGQVILHEAKEDRSGGLSLTIDITDGTGSVSVYSRTDKERYKEIASDLKPGKSIQVHGTVEPDFHGEHSHIRAKAIRRIKKNFRPERQDTYPEKRVELHMHSKMSEMDAVSSPTELVQQAARWGHPAVAITDHGVCQGFPEAMTAADGLPIKVIYGVEVYLVDDLQDAVTRDQGQKLDDEFVVFDIETTGFNKESDQIIEIGAVKIRGGEVIDRFSSFVDPGRHIPDHITKLTSITDEDVAGSDPIEKVLPRFIDFIGTDAVVAHNAGFDTGFIAAKALALGLPAFENTVVDTLALSRGLYNTLKKYTLDAVCRHLGISLENHHRAVDDAEACAGIYMQCVKELEEREVSDLSGINELIRAGIDAKRLKA
jgi:DNA polymerase III epsilon subunit family exonuclease